jgi:hypothetical protein
MSHPYRHGASVEMLKSPPLASTLALPILMSLNRCSRQSISRLYNGAAAGLAEGHGDLLSAEPVR